MKELYLTHAKSKFVKEGKILPIKEIDGDFIEIELEEKGIIHIEVSEDKKEWFQLISNCKPMNRIHVSLRHMIEDFGCEFKYCRIRLERATA